MDHHRVVCGFAEGYLTVWDIQRRTLSKTIHPIERNESVVGKDGHLHGVSIIHLAYVGGKSDFVSVDNEVGL
jgi:hypothetical protein